MSLIYREFRPSPALRSIVDRLWWLEGPAEAIGSQPILPDGHPEIIVHGGDPFAELAADGSLRVQDRVLLAGQATRAVQLAPRGSARIVGARLRPYGARALFGVPQHELTDRITDLQTIDGHLACVLRQDVATRERGDEMVVALDRALSRAAAAAPPAMAAARAVGIAMDRRGLVRVAQLAASLSLGPRQLERLFREHVGLAPKLFLRVVRFQEVLRAVGGRANVTSWADLAARHGYYDQAHFIHDFKSFVGEPPTAWNIDHESLAAIFSAVGRRDRPGEAMDVNE